MDREEVLTELAKPDPMGSAAMMLTVSATEKYVKRYREIVVYR